MAILNKIGKIKWRYAHFGFLVYNVSSEVAMEPIIQTPVTQRALRLQMLRLLENPFEDFTDGRYFVPTPQVARIYQEVRQRWLGEQNGLVLIDGEDGSGKSSLARFLAGGHLPSPLALAVAPRTANRLLKLINDGLGLPRVKEEKRRRERLHAFLEKQYAGIVIDLAQQRLLPSTAQLIADLAQRTTVVVTGYAVFSHPWEARGIATATRYLLTPWDYDTLVFVMEEITRRAGRVMGSLFTAEALERLYMLSQGNPRGALHISRSALEALLESSGTTIEPWMLG